jgi:hypothetical protein
MPERTDGSRRKANAAMIAVIFLAGGAGWYFGGRGDAPAKAFRGHETIASRELRPTRKAAQKVDRSPQEMVKRYREQDPMGPNIQAQSEAWKIISGYNAAQCREGLEALGECLDFDRFELHAMLYTRWAELDPIAAMEDVQLHSDRMKATFRHAILSTWVRDDPETACRWAMRNLEKDERPSLHRMMAGVLVEQGTRSALEKAGLLGEEFVSATVGKLAAMAAEDERVRRELEEALKDQPEDVRRKATKAMILRLGQLDPEGTLATLEQHGLAGEKGRDSARNRILGSWAQTQPAAALDWAEAHVDTVSAGERAQMFERWSRSQPDEAIAWLEAQPQPGTLAMGLAKNLYQAVVSDTLGDFQGETRQAKAAADFARSYRMWAAEKPEEAAKWRETMVPGVRSMLEGGAR